MPAQPGETLLVTLFADVHYYFSDPASKPVHHRLSKASYVYVYHNSVEQRAKLEVANHAGTPEQDAFFGYLTAASKVRYSYKQPTLCTITLDGPSVQSQAEWHLPSYNERNEQKYLYKIHTIDLYLWTEKDAATFLGHVKAVLPAEKLDIRDAPASLQPSLAEHRSSMSPVVQQLERTAIGAHFPPRAESTASTHSFPGPPTPSTTSGVATSSPPPQQQAPVPFAYNPAAPSAPEPIAHREKTPPPSEDGSGTGLSTAGRYDNVPQTQYASVPQGFQPSLQNTPQANYFPGPPQLQQQRQPSTSSIPSFSGPPQHSSPGSVHRTTSGQLPPPPPPPTGGPSPLQHTPSFGPVPSSQPLSPPPTQQTFNRQSSYGAPTQQYASYPQQTTAQFAPSAGFQPPGFPPTPGFLQHQQQQQPPTPSAPPAYGMHTPLQSPGFPLQSPGFPPNTPGFPPTAAAAVPPPPASQPQQQQHQHHSSQQQAAQIAGYSNYTYSQQPSQPTPGSYGAQGAYTGDIHNQLYRPTESEAAHGAKPYQPQQPGTAGQPDGFSNKYKVNERVDKVEKGVGRFLKKLDSKW